MPRRCIRAPAGRHPGPQFAYGKTWAECDTKRRELLAKVDQGVPVPTRSAKLAEWLPYWLENVIKPRRKRTTYAERPLTR